MVSKGKCTEYQSQKIDKSTRIAQIISDLQNSHIDSLTAEQLIEISKRLFKLVTFCKCIQVKEVLQPNRHDWSPIHACRLLFNRRDSIHVPVCKCCQTRLFVDYLSWCLQRLNDQNQLPEFEQNRLTKAKVRDRTYGFTKSKSKFHFKIVCHMNAWKDLSRYEEIIQTWDFDFEKLALTKLQ